MTPEQVIRQYYDCFNARRFEDASAMLQPDAHLETHALGWRQDGSGGYVTFTRRWLSAFPDGRVTVERIDRAGDAWYEVSLIGEGTHAGAFDTQDLVRQFSG